MAKSKLVRRHTEIDKTTVTGVVSEDGAFIVYEDENGASQTVTVQELLDPFRGVMVSLCIADKVDEDV